MVPQKLQRPKPCPTEPWLVQFGVNLRAWRKLKEITAVELAQRAGVARATLHKLERGDPGVHIENVFNVLNALGVLTQFVESSSPASSEIGRDLLFRRSYNGK